MFILDLFEAQQKQTLVLIPGGFHPFHPGHLSLYRAAEQAFPGAHIVYVATDDRKDRPFPFAEKQKLAQIAGVNPKNFQLVKSPFVAKEVTGQYDPDNTVLIFARSEKDRNEPPGAGGVKKDGTPSYLQPYHKGNLAPMSQHGYMVYLPTVQFDAGPSGVTSATQIRTMWPQADDAQKNAIIADLYPRNPAVARQILDKYLGGGLAEGLDGRASATPAINKRGKFTSWDENEPMRLKCQDGEFRTIQEINVLRQKMGMKPFSIKGEQGVAEGRVLHRDLKSWTDDAKSQGLNVIKPKNDLEWTHHATDKTGKVCGKFCTTNVPQNSRGFIHKQGVAEGSNDTVYPNAEVIKSKNGKPVGEIYQDANGWGCFHYKADNGADSISSREEALEWLKDLHDEYRQDRSLREQGVAEGIDKSLLKQVKQYCRDAWMSNGKLWVDCDPLQAKKISQMLNVKPIPGSVSGQYAFDIKQGLTESVVQSIDQELALIAGMKKAK